MKEVKRAKALRSTRGEVAALPELFSPIYAITIGRTGGWGPRSSAASGTGWEFACVCVCVQQRAGKSRTRDRWR